MRALLALPLAIGLLLASAAPEPAPVQLLSPLPFDHGAHARSLDKAGLDCLSCHPVGLRLTPPAKGAPLDDNGVPIEVSGPRSSCHGCHLGELPKAPRRAPSTCSACHASVVGLMPEDHDQSWAQAHAEAARMRQASCADCHEGRWCTDCHLDRGPVTQNPHGTGFRFTHGVEARLDPARCTSCHTGPSCTQCHTSGSVAW